ncbi:unnamed protein product [Calicophoron daubneyi]|uniref:Sodium/myo-inositol cotransporter n=1 Tax=Calicophoron daubneyi TaxID=300641 RepID=A0AAV2TF21_CALDB
MKRRYGGSRIQIYLAGLSLLLYVFTKISVNLYSGSLFLQEALQWSEWISIILILTMTALITLTGGLAAVLYTDTLQCFVMVLGALILSILSFGRVGGFKGLLKGYGRAIAHLDTSTPSGQTTLVALLNASSQTSSTELSQLIPISPVGPSLQCRLPSSKAFKLLREADDPDMPWLGFIIGQTPASIWYWCADQMMVQRALAAKSLSHAQGGTLMAGLLKQLPLFIIVFPGMISRILFPDEVACVPGPDCKRVCGQSKGCSNLAYPKLVVGIMPSGLRGLMLSVMLAALISDLTSIFNSASTLFTVDIYRRFREQAEERELMIVGRLFVVLLVGISIAWVPVVQGLQGSQLYIYIQAVAAYLSPPIASVFLATILWKRATERGAFYGLMYGLIIGLARLALNAAYTDPICGEEDTRPWILQKVHYMYFAMFSFISTGLLMVIISLLDTAPSTEQVSRLTYWTAWDPKPSVVPQNIDETGDTGRRKHVKRDQPNVPVKVSSKAVIQSSDDMTITYRSGDFITSINSVGPRSQHVFNCLRHAFRWFCGCEERPCPAHEEGQFLSCICCCSQGVVNAHGDPTAEGEDREKRGSTDEDLFALQMQNAISLQQDPWAKVGLRIGLVLTVIVSVFGFVFFSVYFDPITSGPIPLKNAENNTLPENVTKAIDMLKRLNFVTEF